MKTTISILLCLLLANTGHSQTMISDALLGDIQKAQADGTTVEALIVLGNQFNTEALDHQLTLKKATAHERGVAMVNALMAHTEATQADLAGLLESRINSDVIRYKRFWITNMIWVEARPEFLYELAQHKDVAMLEQNERMIPIEPVSMQPATALHGYTEPGLIAINAHKMWQLGFTGEGVIVGSIENGVDGTHPALLKSWHGNSVPASQAWYDPTFGTPFPTGGGHGTHVMGIMVGLDSIIADTIGVAYGAEWISARMNSWSVSEIIDRFEWMADPDGDPGTTDDMPAVVNNSWGSTIGPCNPSYMNAIINLETVGVAVIFSAGNKGPDASTMNEPAKSNISNLQIFSVGAVDGNFEDFPIAEWSSRGPTPCSSGGDSIKPEVSAPGVAVLSSFTEGTYRYGWGTSMATPHVSGAIALLKQAFPDKTGNELKQMVYETAHDLGEPGEDNTYGKGIIDVYQAYIENTIPENPRPPNDVTAYNEFLLPTMVYLYWTDPSNLVNGAPLQNFEINIYRDNTLIANVAKGVGSYTDNGLNDGQFYMYELKTHDLVSGNMSIGRMIGVYSGGSRIPAAPSITSGYYDKQNEVAVIHWSDPTTQSDGTFLDDLGMIQIYRENQLIASVSPGTETYLDHSAPGGQSYSYTLKASDTETPVNYSMPSKEAEIFCGVRPDILVYYGTASGPVIGYADSVYRTIRSFNIPVHKTDDLSEFGLLNYKAVFVITGMLVPYDHYIYDDDATGLLEFMNNGGSIYIEGNGCFNYFKDSGWGVYDIRPWLGLDPGNWTVEPVNELTGLNVLADYHFQNTGQGHLWDIMNPVNSTSTLWEDPGTGNIYGVYNEYNTGKIIGVVLPFGGLSDTTSTFARPLLMCKYLEMLGLPIPCGNVGIQDKEMNSSPLTVHITPNPVKDFTLIEYNLEKEAAVILTIFNLYGQTVDVLIDEDQQAGRKQVTWNTESYPAGLYFYSLQTGRKSETGKILLIR